MSIGTVVVVMLFGTRRGSLGLRARASLAWALIAFALASVISVVAYQVIRAELLDERRGRASAQAHLNARLVRAGLRGSEPDVAAILASLEGNAGSSAIVRVDGQWFATSVDADPALLPSSLVEVVEAGDAGRVLDRADGEPQVVVGVPIAEASAEYFEVVALDDVDETLDAFARALVVSAGVATVVAAIIGWYVSGRVLRPVRRMADAASHIADGEFDTRLDALGDRDLVALEVSFNRMADAVQERIVREKRFTSDVSHELRSPLAAMLSSIDVARRHEDDPTGVRLALDHLEERTSAFHELVVDLLEISRADAGVAELQVERVRPAELVRAAIEMTGSDEVVVDVAPGVPETIRVDKRRLGRCLMSLLENAQRYAGGATRIEIAGAPDAVRFSVVDRGPGIPEHERRHVFGRFARGDAARTASASGTGLGLALVEEHVRLHGGRVFIEAPPGGGACFVIELPVGGGSG